MVGLTKQIKKKMNKTELQGIIGAWWVWNEEQSQMGEAYQFESQIGDWESGFRNWSKEGYQADTTFQIVKCKDIRLENGLVRGLSIRLESGIHFTDGILNIKTGEWVEKEIVGNVTGSFVVRGASIDG